MEKKETIIDDRIFARSVLWERVIFEDEDMAWMNLVVSHVKQQDLYRIGSLHPENYDDAIVEEFYLDAIF